MKSHTHKKHFGQHFLIDEAVIHDIIQSINAQYNDTLIEIGTGTGALTYPLLQQVKKLHVVEIDNELIAYWNNQSIKNLRIHHHSILEFDIANLGQDLRIIGNLPYNISSLILFKMLENRHIIKDMIFMVQKEVAMRITSHSNTKIFGRLSVMMQTFFDCELLFDVPNTAFKPIPKVTSSIIYIKPKRAINTPQSFSFIVKNAFRMKRKTLRNNLKQYLPQEHSSIDMNKRAESLNVDDFITLSKEYETYLSHR